MKDELKSVSALDSGKSRHVTFSTQFQDESIRRKSGKPPPYPRSPYPRSPKPPYPEPDQPIVTKDKQSPKAINKLEPSSPNSDESSSSPIQVEPKPDKYKSSKFSNPPISAEQPNPYPVYPQTQAQSNPAPYGQPKYYAAYSPQPQLQPQPVVQYQPPPRPPPQPLVGGIMRVGTTSEDKACCCHLTCCTLVWLCFDVLICGWSVFFNFRGFVSIKADPNSDKTYYETNFLVTGAANAFFILTTIFGFVGLFRSNTTLLLIYVIRCLFVTLFQLSVNIWVLILWTKIPFHKKNETSDDRKTSKIAGILAAVLGMIWSLWFIYGGWLAWRCRNYYKNLNR